MTTQSLPKQCPNRKRFTALWNRLFVKPTFTDPLTVHEELTRRYSEPHRHYHTCEHIDFCLSQFDRTANLMDNADAVETALWFHDLVYSPGASDNELRSAELFMEFIGNHVNPVFSDRVYELIMITTHRKMPVSMDDKFIVDIDLAGFGLPWEKFERNGQKIRAEYNHLSDAEFFLNQLAFLRSMVQRSTFFFTDYFGSHYETRAQKNIRRRIAELSAQGYR